MHIINLLIIADWIATQLMRSAHAHCHSTEAHLILEFSQVQSRTDQTVCDKDDSGWCLGPGPQREHMRTTLAHQPRQSPSPASTPSMQNVIYILIPPSAGRSS